MDNISYVFRRYAITALLFILILGSVWWISAMRSQINSSEAFIVSSPSEITTTYIDSDGKISSPKQVSSEDVLHLSPGKYEFTFYRDNFQTVTKEVSIGEVERTIIPVRLEPTNNTGEKELESKENQLALQGVSDIENVNLESEDQELMIVNRLPYEDFLLSIKRYADPDEKSGDALGIEISAFEGYRQSGINLIKKWGYDPSSYDIHFTGGYRNPFEL